MGELSDKEINERVATEVMKMIACDGYSQINLGSAGGPALRRDCKHEKGTCYPAQTIESAWGKIGGCPNYAGDIKAAIEVIERVADVYHIVKTDHPNYQDAPYEVTIYKHRRERSSRMGKFEATSHKLERAICLAVLAACGEE
jgi:hypothetical protein